MNVVRTGIALLLTVGLIVPASAQDLRKSAEKAVESDAAQPQTLATPPSKNGSKNGLFWAGTAMFIGGMGVGLYGFINDKNGKFAEFGEANTENKHLGAAGLSVAFAGGALMFLGSRQGRMKAAPSIAVGPHAVAVSKRLSW
jgi:hypothetical protein